MAFECFLVLAFIFVVCSRQTPPSRSRRVPVALITTLILAASWSFGLPYVQGAAPPTDGKAAAPAGEAGALFRRFCQGCHGADGRGAGRDVPDFTRSAWQEKRTDTQLVVTILEGKGTV